MCPLCKEKIASLIAEGNVMAFTEFHYWPNSPGGQFFYDDGIEIPFPEEMQAIAFACPLCNEIVAEDEHLAEAILMGVHQDVSNLS